MAAHSDFLKRQSPSQSGTPGSSVPEVGRSGGQAPSGPPGPNLGPVPMPAIVRQVSALIPHVEDSVPNSPAGQLAGISGDGVRSTISESVNHLERKALASSICLPPASAHGKAEPKHGVELEHGHGCRQVVVERIPAGPNEVPDATEAPPHDAGRARCAWSSPNPRRLPNWHRNCLAFAPVVGDGMPRTKRTVHTELFSGTSPTTQICLTFQRSGR